MLDIDQDRLDRGSDLGIVLGAVLGVATPPEILSHRYALRLLDRLGLIGDPAGPGKCNGGAVKKNS
jgi:hypothetical protein